ncbi:MAG: PAS domain S-box protein [Promethearchaeota archaeon]
MSMPPEENTVVFLKKNSASREKKEAEEISRDSNIKIENERDNITQSLDSIKDGICIVDRSYNIEYVNPIMIKEFGSPKNKKCYEYIYVRSKPCSWCKISDILKGKTIISEKDFDINQKTYEVIDVPSVSINGTISNLKIFHDITNLKNTINALRLDEERLNSLLKLSQMKSKSKKEITEFALEECVKLTNSKVGYLVFVNEDQETVHLYLWSKNVIDQCYQEENTHYPIKEAGIWADAFRFRKPVIHNDYQSNPNKKGYPEGHFPVLRHMSIPVFDGEKIVAIVGVGNKGDPYDQTDVRQLTLFMESMWSLLKKKEEEIVERDKKYFKFLKDLQYFNTSINTSQNLKELLFILLNAVLSLFNCDRVFLMYPLDPETKYWEIPVEVTKPEYPGASLSGRRLPMCPEIAQINKLILGTSKTVSFGPNNAFEFPPGEIWGQFKIKSALLIRIQPKIGKHWEFGIHQCSHPRVWNNFEKELFTEISHRISDSLSNWLFFQKLKESEQLYHGLYEEAPNAYFSVTNDGRIVRCNKAAVRLLGYSKEEILKISVFDLYAHTEEGIIKAKKLFQQFLAGNQIRDEVLQMKRKNGELVWISLTVKAIKDHDGNVIESRSMVIDISKRMQIEQELNRSNTENKAILSANPDLIFEFDKDGIYHLVKGKIKDLFLPPEKLLGKKVTEILPKDIGLLTVENINKTLQTGETQIFEYELIIEGEQRYWEARTSISREDRVMAVIREITKRKKAEQKLKESEEKFSKAFHSSPIIIAISRMGDGCFIEINKAFLETLGYTRDEVIGRTSRELNLWGIPGQREELIKALHANKLNLVEVPINSKTGEELILLFSGEVIVLDDEKYLITLASDITDRKKTEQKLIESEEKLRKINIELESLVEKRTKELKNSEHNLRERIKELSCVYGISQLFDKSEFSIDGFIKETLNLIPPAMQYPDITCARVTLDNKDYKTKNYKETNWILSTDIRIDGRVLKLEIAYLENKPFLKEETDLLNEIAKLLKVIIERKESEQKLSMSEAQLKEMNMDLENRVEKRTRELKDSEQKYSAIVNAFEGLIYICSQDYRVEYMNENLIQRTGYDGTGELCYKVLHDLDDVCSWCVNDRVFKGETVKWEVQSPKDNHWFYVVNTPIKHPDGTISKQAMIMDITENKEAELKIKESEEKFSKAFNSNALSMSISSIEEDRFIEANDVFLNDLEYTRKEVIGKTSVELNLWVDMNQRDEVIRIVKERGSLSNYEVRFRTKTGDIRHGLFSVSKITLRNKHYLLNIVNDITEYKRAELKLKESESKFRHLFEDSPFMIVLINKDGKIVDFNNKVLNYTGYHKKELLDKDLMEISKITVPYNLRNISKKFRELWKNGSVEPIELQYRNKDNSLIWIKVNSSKVKIGSETFIQLIIENIEKVKQAEKLIKKELKKLKELDQIRQDLINRISHELKTPLTSIFGVSQAFMEIPTEELNEDVSEYLGILNKGSLRLKALINNLLDASRLDVKRIELKFQDENLSMLIRECVDDMKYLMTSRKHIIKFDPPNELFFRVDKIRMSQAITNLISNAIKNTPVGGIIFIYVNEMEKYIDINIKDTGVGLTKKEKEQLFQKFGKIERYGQNLEVDIEGVGLGLYISKEIVELHGGEILVESKGRHKGATFTIRLYKKK